MADKAIGQLNSATAVNSVDLFVLEQNGEAKKLTGQILENWLVSFADGHGGIHSIAKTSSSGTNPVVDTYTITLSDTTTYTFTVTNGVKGDTGARTYVWIKYSGSYPTQDSDMGSSPDNYIGIYVGLSSSAPTHYTDYVWFEWKGEKGDTGDPASIVTEKIEYQESSSGTVMPSGAWSSSVPTVQQGSFLWTKGTLEFNSGEPLVWYSVSYQAVDGQGSPGTATPLVDSGTGNTGTAMAYSRQDHQHPLNVASSGAPEMDGTASRGDATTYARSNHVHPTDTSRQAALVSGTNIKTVGGASILGRGNITVANTVNGASGTVVLGAADVGAMSEWELLWANASPTSQFAGQDVPLGLSSYDAVYINYVYTSGDIYAFAIIPVGMNSHVRYTAVTSNNIQFTNRDTSVSTTKVVFSDATTTTQGSSSSQTANARLLPYHIYGIKGFNNS